MKVLNQMLTKQEFKGSVHCPICTHNVEADVVMVRKATYAKPGQKCPRCSASLDAAYVMRYDQAA